LAEYPIRLWLASLQNLGFPGLLIPPMGECVNLDLAAAVRENLHNLST